MSTCQKLGDIPERVRVFEHPKNAFSFYALKNIAYEKSIFLVLKIIINKISIYLLN